MSRIKIITIPLSRRRMFYIMLNIYIFNLFKEPLAINSMAYSLQIISIKHINIHKINVYFWQPGFQKGDNLNTNRTQPLHNLSERVHILGHAQIICITVVHNRIICCQIFCDLLINSVKAGLILSVTLQSKKKWNSSSNVLHNSECLWFRGIFLQRPSSISKLWSLKRNFVNNWRFLKCL
jgi:hypothetical protein